MHYGPNLWALALDVVGAKRGQVASAVLPAVPASPWGCCSSYPGVATGLAGAVSAVVVAAVDVASSFAVGKSLPDAAVAVAAVVAAGSYVACTQLDNFDSWAWNIEGRRTWVVASVALAGRKAGCSDHDSEMTRLRQGSLTEGYGIRVDRFSALRRLPSDPVFLSILSALHHSGRITPSGLGRKTGFD